MNKERIKRIDEAMIEVDRFVERAIKWRKRLGADKYASISGCREAGDCKRSSLDLSRALVRLRGKIYN